MSKVYYIRIEYGLKDPYVFDRLCEREYEGRCGSIPLLFSTSRKAGDYARKILREHGYENIIRKNSGEDSDYGPGDTHCIYVLCTKEEGYGDLRELLSIWEEDIL